MSLPRLDHATHIADRLNELAAIVKTRSRASLTDGNRILEPIATRFFNALFGWDLINLNTEWSNYPAADLGDRRHRIAIQVTNEDGSDKIERTAMKAVEHQLGNDFDRLIVFFLLSKKPGFPRNFTQPVNGPMVETWDIADLLKQLQDLADLDAIGRAAKVLDQEMGKMASLGTGPRFDISRILKYAPAELIGRDDELKLLHPAWSGDITSPLTIEGSPFTFRSRPRILTFVALGGEGKTSLVAKWAAELAAQDWPGCDAAFAWSFYSQGTREQMAASSDLFLKAALTFFGDDTDKAFAASPAGAFEKGQRLARLVGQRRSLLILDGLEPLQYAPTAPTPGELKDQGIASLLKGLAAASQGLCVVTTRFSLPDLRAFWQTTAPEVKLLHLSRDAGVHLLRTLGVTGTAEEFAALVEDVKGHALTLTLLGGFLKRAFHGDIRKRDCVKFEKADEKMDGGHAFRTMAAYEQWLLSGGDEGRREVAVLRLMGLFDRPADAGCLAALRNETIPGLTEPLAGLADDDWEYCLTGLEATRLLTVNRDAGGALVSLDAHPLLREYFARELRAQQPDAWRAAHRRLYGHLCASTKEGDQPTLEDLQPLYQAVAHGCQAGLQQEVYDSLLRTRIQLGEKKHSWRVLGAFGADLGALACFFDKTWDEVSQRLNETSRIHILRSAAFRLVALGRQFEALEPAEKSAQIAKRAESWSEASGSFVNVTQIRLMLGSIDKAVESAKLAVECIDRNLSDIGQVKVVNRMNRRAIYADALCQAGRYEEATQHFTDAEELARQNLELNILGGLSGFRYCNLLLRQAERVAWQAWMAGDQIETNDQPANPQLIEAIQIARKRCYEIELRVSRSTDWFSQRGWLLDIAVNDLTLGFTWTYRAAFALWCRRRTMVADSHDLEQKTDPDSFLQSAKSQLDKAMIGLRQANQMNHLPLGLLTRAWLRVLTGARTGPESAQADLDEAWEIAERGRMKLFLADIHLHRARLFFREQEYPWNKNPDGTPRGPKDGLAAAEKLINECGYHRRDEELADAKRAILGT